MLHLQIQRTKHSFYFTWRINERFKFVKIKDHTWQLDAAKFAQSPAIKVFLLSFIKINDKIPGTKVTFIYSTKFATAEFIDYIRIEFNNDADEAFFQVYFSEFIS